MVSTRGGEQRAIRVLMIVENCPFRRDPRVRREARTLVAAGYEVSVISPNTDENGCGLEIVEGVHVYRFPKFASSSTIVGHLLEYFFAILAIGMMSIYVWIREGFDIIHIANPPDGLILIAGVYKSLGKAVIYDQHDLCPELYGVKFGSPNDFIAKILRSLERLSYSLADRVIVTNESYKRLAMNRGCLAESAVTVVRNGPDLENAENVEIDPQVRAKSPIILAFAGITETQDGLEYLIRGLHELRYKLGRDEFLCIVMGAGHALESAKSLAHSLDLDSNLWFTGWISDRPLYARYLATSDICVSPEPSNAYNDPSTFVKIMEYMAAAKPIVAFDLPETRFSAGQSALYAKCNEEEDLARNIARLMDDAALRWKMGQMGQRRIREKLAWQYSAPGLVGAYESLMNRV